MIPQNADCSKSIELKEQPIRYYDVCVGVDDLGSGEWDGNRWGWRKSRMDNRGDK